MGKKKEITPETAISQWQEMTQRASLTDYRNVNGVIIGTNDRGQLVLVVPDHELLTLLLAAGDEVKILSYDQDDKDTINYLPWFSFGLRLEEDGWLPIDGDEFYGGKVMIVSLTDGPDNFISKDSLPLKLKKAEFTDLGYRVFPAEHVIGITKRFEVLPAYGFTLIKLYQMI